MTDEFSLTQKEVDDLERMLRTMTRRDLDVALRTDDAWGSVSDDLWAGIAAQIERDGVAEAASPRLEGLDDRVPQSSATKPLFNDSTNSGSNVVDLSGRFRNGPAVIAAIAAASALIIGVFSFSASANTEVVGEATLAWDEAFVVEGQDLTVVADFLAAEGSHSVRIAESSLPIRDDEDLELWLIGVSAEGDLTIQTLGVIDDTAAPGTFEVPAEFDPDSFESVLVDISYEPRDGNQAHSGASIVRGPITDI